MALRGARQEHARATTAAWLGTFESDANLRGLFLKAIPPAE
jgi:GTP cyclohydrolase I